MSIVSVGDKPKKIFDMGVFAITSIMSVLAYVWLYIVLKAWTPEEVTIIEAVLTLVYFVVLVGLSYAADRYNASVQDSNKTAEDIEESDRKTEIQQWRTQLKHYKNQYSVETIIAVAQGYKGDQIKDIKKID